MLQLGDVLYRFLPHYQVWHAGIVAVVDGNNWNDIEVLEFDDSNKISLVPLKNYMFHRKYFWVCKFQEERNIYGDRVFNSRKKTLENARKLWRENSLTYTLHKYNCEYFVRRCVFKYPKLWPSSQTESFTRSRELLGLKLITIAIFNSLYKINKKIDLEKDLRPNDDRYTIKNGEVVPA